jgi:hypothetical protein
VARRETQRKKYQKLECRIGKDRKEKQRTTRGQS